MKPLLVGEAPSRTGDRYWRFPLSGAPSRSICAWMGWGPDGATPGGYFWRVRQHFDTVNVVKRWPGAQGKGAALPPAMVREGWDRMREDGDVVPGSVVVLLGRRIGDALGVELREHSWSVLDFDTLKRSTACVAPPRRLLVTRVPHPSGLNRVYNDPAERGKTAETLRSAMYMAQAAGR